MQPFHAAGGYMRRIVSVVILGAFCTLSSSCREEVIRVPQGRSGDHLVAGAVRARSSHFKILSAMDPSGGPHNSPTIALRNGAYINGKE